MNQPPLVSVVVIFRDAERFLEEAIASVLAQTYPDWELLMVDDGSVDDSTMVARRMAERHPGQMRYLQHPGGGNRGMSASRNLGIRHARGEYLAFLDADDAWFPDALTEQVGLLEAHPEAAMVYGPIQWWYSWTGRPEDQDRDYVEGLGVLPDTVVRAPKLLPLFLLDKAAVPSGVLARREIVAQVGAFEDAFRGEYEDQVFCAKICLNYSVFAAGRCWYRYRQHRDSCVSVGLRTGQTHAARVAFLEWLAAYLSQERVRYPIVWWALWYELWRSKHPTQFRWWTHGNYLARRVMSKIVVSSRKVAGMAQ